MDIKKIETFFQKTFKYLNFYKNSSQYNSGFARIFLILLPTRYNPFLPTQIPRLKI